MYFGSFIPSFFPYGEWDKAAVQAVAMLPPTGLSIGIDFCKTNNAQFIPVSWDVGWFSRPNSIGFAITQLLLGAVIWTLIGWWVDNIRPSEFGVARRPWFCLTPAYWQGMLRCGGGAGIPGDLGSGSTSVSPEEFEALAGDRAFTDAGHFEPLTRQEKGQLMAGDCVHINGLTKKYDTADGQTRVAIPRPRFFTEKAYSWNFTRDPRKASEEDGSEM